MSGGSGGSWDDLKPRVISGAVLAVVGAGAVWAGGVWFLALIAISSGLMIWELGRMVSPELGSELIIMGGVAALAVVLTTLLPGVYTAPIILGFVGAAWSRIRKTRTMFFLYALLIMVAGYGFIQLRQDIGLIWMLWLLLVVVTSDMAGYVAGRLLGGPKFWPAVSPKKTWSGTIAGWIGAGVVGLFFEPTLMFALMSAAVAFAAQMGDIAESAIKRKCGIKDSSNLIPGHGGFMDRFDGMLGASVVVLLLVLLTDFAAIG